MSASSSFLSISRAQSVSNALRGFSILVDDKVIDKINVGEIRKYSLPGGRHIIRVAIDFYKSEPLSIDLKPGETVSIECGDNAPKAWGEALSLKGLGQSLKTLTNPGDFLYVRLTGRNISGPQPGATGAQSAEAAGRDRPARPDKRRKGSDLRIFLSYRREDSRAFTGRICDRLIQHFGDEAIFRDVDSIPIGMDFRDNIRETLEQADVLIAVIGPSWLAVRNSKGEQRIALEEDYVRVEIESALSQGIPVMPVLVNEAAVLQSHELPDNMAQLAYINALQIPREPFFHAGVDKLIEDLEELAGANNKSVSNQGFCTGCGKTLQRQQKFCTGCGRQV